MAKRKTKRKKSTAKAHRVCMKVPAGKKVKLVWKKGFGRKRKKRK